MNGSLLDVVTGAQSDARRRRLLDQGMARAILRRDGVEPADGPNFSDTLTSELLSYGFSQIVGALSLRHDEDPQQRALADQIFREIGEAIYAVSKNAASDPMNGFYTVIAAAAFHLGGYAARAFSCLPFDTRSLNLSIPERVFSALMRRELLMVRTLAAQHLEGHGSRKLLAELAASEDFDRDYLIESAWTGAYCGALVRFCRALFERSPAYYDQALRQLDTLLNVAGDLGAVPIWWTTRLTIEVLGDLWHYSVENVVPQEIDGGGADWGFLRDRYIGNLLLRDHSEVELWPSQIEAAKRVFADNRSIVIALPTGAGKTRIAEFAILKCLAQGRRVVYVTPLRALSAQVERNLSRAFSIPNVRISALYSAIGAQAIDLYALQHANIVVLTPEKLHFALRLEPQLLDDVGLIVLDEGHMIGLKSSREIRYEVLVQKLLTRADAAERRLMCLSAVLPSGEDLHDFAAWDLPRSRHIPYRNDVATHSAALRPC